MNTNEQIKRIQLIMGHPSMVTCFDCSKVYLPMNKITKYLCPYCQQKEIEEVKSGKLELDIEMVSTDNDDLLLFDKPYHEKEIRREKALIGAKKAKISKILTKRGKK